MGETLMCGGLKLGHLCRTIHCWSFLNLQVKSLIWKLISDEPCHEKTCLMLYASNEGVDQPVHLRSLISAFVVHYLDSIISMLAKYKISRLASLCSWAGWFESYLDTNSRRQVFSWHGSDSIWAGPCVNRVVITQANSKKVKPACTCVLSQQSLCSLQISNLDLEEASDRPISLALFESHHKKTCL